MSSERKIQSSRANGAKSKGPITADGKKRSSANSRRHGLLSSAIVLEGENLPDFLELLAGFERQFKPVTQNQKVTVERMAVAQWRLMRVWGYEKTALTDEIARVPICEGDQPGDISGRAFLSLAERSRGLDVLARYEDRFNRIYNRCLRVLRLEKT
jgi:hypothetical protein